MRVSTTERQLYKRCRRKWSYASWNRQSLGPIINAPALDLGTVVHACLAKWTDEPTADPAQIYEDISIQHMLQIQASYRERIGCDPSEAELMPTMEQLALGQHMIRNYQQRWHTPLPPGFTLLQNELSLVVDVPGTEHCKCDAVGQLCHARPQGCRYCDAFPSDPICQCHDSCGCIATHQLECTFDGVMADANGDLFIIERKTFKQTPQLEELTNNDQFLAYQWALSQVRSNVVGVAYDGLLKKPAPSGVHKDLASLFLRRLLLRPQAELDEFGQLLALELNEMANPNVPIYKTVPPIVGCGRWECSFLDVCHAQSKGEPTADLLKMFVHSDRKQHLEVET